MKKQLLMFVTVGLLFAADPKDDPSRKTGTTPGHLDCRRGGTGWPAVGPNQGHTLIITGDNSPLKQISRIAEPSMDLPMNRKQWTSSQKMPSKTKPGNHLQQKETTQNLLCRTDSGKDDPRFVQPTAQTGFGDFSTREPDLFARHDALGCRHSLACSQRLKGPPIAVLPVRKAPQKKHRLETTDRVAKPLHPTGSPTAAGDLPSSTTTHD